MEDWIDKKLGGYPGFKLRIALKEEPWTLVVLLPREQVASEGEIKDMLDKSIKSMEWIWSSKKSS